MTTSASTPRIRITQLLYLGVLLLAALSDGRLWQGMAGVAVSAAGVALVVLAVLGRLWASLFIAGRKDAEVVTDGPYAACRHPLYLCSLVGGAGLGLASRSVVLAAAVPVVLACVLGVAIAREERYLAARHGERWNEYARTVPRVWPRWRQFLAPVPAAVTRLDVATYRKAFVDAAAFLGVLLLLVAADVLHALGAWSSPLALP